MSDDPTTEPAAGEVSDPLFLQPSAADNAPRIASAKPADKSIPVDPEAPFGWMNDPTAPGGRRPKKAPGRQTSKSAQKAAAPPANRRANKPRTITGTTVDKAPERSYASKVGDLTDTVWMVTAAVPIADAKVFGRDIRPIATKAKAQGALIRDQRMALIQGLATMAEHSSAVARGIDWLAGDDGPGWLLPAAMALMPFAIQSAALWRGSMEAAEPLAARTTAEFAELAKVMMGNVDQGAALEAASALEPPASS